MPGVFARVADGIRASFAALDPRVRLWFHPFVATGLLAEEILAGAAADVFVSANRRYMDEVVAAGLVASPCVVAGNRLCIVVERGRAAEVAGLEDLTRPALRVVTPQSRTDPCGQYVVELFGRAGLTGAMAAKEQSGELFHSRGSGDLPGYVTGGQAAAGILYLSEARGISDAVAVVELAPPLDLADSITFLAGAVGRPDPEPAAQAFVEHLARAPGQQVLERAGMVPLAAMPRPGGGGAG
jgi:molybdate transport system substrate-binding protein